MKGNTTLLECSNLSPRISIMYFDRYSEMEPFNTKVHHSVKTESRIAVLSLCTSSDGAVYLYKISRTNLKRLLMILKH